MNALPHPERRGSLIGPLVLVGIGMLLLLNNFGTLSWGVWAAIARLWPVLLIAAGLELLVGRRSALGSWLVLGLTVLVLGGSIWYLSQRSGADVIGETIVQPLGTARQAEVTIGVDVGTLRIGTTGDSPNLVEATVTHDPRTTITRDVALLGDTARVTLQANSRGSLIMPFGMSQPERRWDVKLSQAVPTQLSITTGVGNATLDLRRANLTGLTVTTGTGQTSLTLPERGVLAATVQSGVGELLINVPSSIAVRISAGSERLGNVTVRGDYQQRDGVYSSPNFDRATNRVTLEVGGGIGNITIRQLAEE